MGRTAVMTDSNSGITQEKAAEIGVSVLPMPFYIDGELFYEDINLTQEQFYEKLAENREVSTSMPSVGDVTDLWEKLLQEYDEIVHIPMSSALSGSCETAYMLAQDYGGRVQVVDNLRISVTQLHSVLDAARLAKQGKGAVEIKNILEREKSESTIYIMVDTLKYLKKGGRITPAVAALGTLLRLKPVLQLQGGKLDSFAKARTVRQAKSMMLEAIRDDCRDRFGDPDGKNMYIDVAYTHDLEAALQFAKEVKEVFPGQECLVHPLSLSVSCHIGPGALGVACTHRQEGERNGA